jgi:hypothetical protein
LSLTWRLSGRWRRHGEQVEPALPDDGRST